MAYGHAAVLAALLVALTPSLVRADDGAEADEAAQPEERVDVVIPAAGLGGFIAPAVSYSRAIFIASAELRWAHGSGHGAMFRGSWGTTVWGEGYGADFDYLYRMPLAGDRHLGLSLD